MTAPTGTVVIICVGLTESIVDAWPLPFPNASNQTKSFATFVSKFVPLMVMGVPICPLLGLTLVTAGDGMTVKLPLLITDCPPTLTCTSPDVAPLGTMADIWVRDTGVTEANVPLNLTPLPLEVRLKFVPVIVTGSPAIPVNGLMEAIVGNGITRAVALVAVCPLVVTVMRPVVAPAGTTAVSWVAVAAGTRPVTPLKVTTLFARVVSKLVPVMKMTSQTTPEFGVNPVIVGPGTPTV